ncbi:MAG: M23 family metallopeptidase [Bacteroidia bacterium]|nr:M23 family metallopeptidase [Bacteroidia bacterium]
MTHSKIIFLLLFFTSSLFAQQYTNPVNIPPALSANFGELRNNHFHSGIDYKTQQVVNKPILAIADGYISRINISPSGYGLALYIDHPTGHTSVYGHLNSFSKSIANYVKEKQYEKESYRIDIYPEPGLLMVKKGEQIALSGNTGNSGGPHLHFEIRDTKTQDPLDPLQFLGRTVIDTQKPDIRGVAFYPIDGKGVVNGSSNPLRLNVGKNKSGVPLALSQPINVWGRIGIAVKAYDRMNGQYNIYGVKQVRLFVDEKQIFSSSINRFSFSKTRILNSFVDFEDWRKRSSFYMKSFVEPGNTLHFYDTVNNGYIDINEERNYRMRYELEDYHGNTLTYSFVIKGQQQPIAQATTCDNFMSWKLHNSFVDFDFMLDMPSGNLYDSFCYSHRKIRSTVYYSDMHQVNESPVPLHKNATMWIKLNADTLENREQYGIVEITERGNDNWIGGTYKRGGLETSIRELGRRYAVDIDTVPPKITPINIKKWVTARRIQIRLTDNKSGIANFKGTIDGKFILFSHDIKSSLYTYIFDDSRLEKGKTQEFVFTATDGVGNFAEYRYKFDY